VTDQTEETPTVSEHKTGTRKKWGCRIGWMLAIVLLVATVAGCGLMRNILFNITERIARKKVRIFVPDSNDALTRRSRELGVAVGLSTEVPKEFDTFCTLLGTQAMARSKTDATARARHNARTATALKVMRCDAVTKLTDACNRVLDRAGPAGKRTAPAPVMTTRRSWTELSRLLEESAQTDAWSAFAADAQFWAAGLAENSKERRRADRIKKTAHYISRYIRAYFTGTPLVTITVDLSVLTQRLKTKLRARLAQAFPDLDADEFLEKLEEKLAEQLKRTLAKLLRKADQARIDEIVGKLVKGQPVKVFGYTLGSGTDQPVGFTTRAGDNFRWPTVEVTIDPNADKVVSWSDIDAKLIGSQLIRVLIEAIFDAQIGIPGASSATGVSFKDHALAKFEPVDEGRPGVTADEFNELNNWSARAEGLASTGTGQLIRGVGWISLNNEALAGIIETAVGVFVRKLAEWALWEVYEKRGHENTDDPAERARRSAVDGKYGRFITIEFSFEKISRPSDDVNDNS